MPNKPNGLTGEQKGLMLVLLGIVAVVAIVALVLMFTSANATGRAIDYSTLEDESFLEMEEDSGNELTGEFKFKKRKGVTCLLKGRGWKC